MINKTIAICGAPLSGKTTILYQLEQSKGNLFALTDSNLEQRTLTLTVRNFQNPTSVKRESLKSKKKIKAHGNIEDLCEIKLITIPGHVYFEKEEKIEFVISQADIIIYVISVEASGFSPSTELQKDYFDNYTNIAKKLNKSWAKIPWIIILNKVDLGKEFPSTIDIPSNLMSDIILTTSTSTQGINLLWERIFRVVLPKVSYKTLRFGDAVS